MGRMGGFTKSGREKFNLIKREQKAIVHKGADEFILKALEMYTRHLEQKEGGTYLVTMREGGVQLVAPKYQFDIRVQNIQVY